jgi:hypothetical protein
LAVQVPRSQIRQGRFQGFAREGVLGSDTPILPEDIPNQVKVASALNSDRVAGLDAHAAQRILNSPDPGTCWVFPGVDTHWPMNKSCGVRPHCCAQHRRKFRLDVEQIFGHVRPDGLLETPALTIVFVVHSAYVQEPVRSIPGVGVCAIVGQVTVVVVGRAA